LLESLSAAVNSSLPTLAGDCFPSGSNAPFDAVRPADLTDLLPSSSADFEGPSFHCVNDDETRRAPSTTLPEEDEGDDLNVKDASNAGGDKMNGRCSTTPSDDNGDGTSNRDKDDGMKSASLADMDENGNGSGMSSVDEASAPSKKLPPPVSSAIQKQQTSKKPPRKPSTSDSDLTDSDGDMDENGNGSGMSSVDKASAPSKKLPPPVSSAVQKQQTSKKRRRKPSTSASDLTDSDGGDSPTNKFVQGGKSSSDPIDVDFYVSLWEPSSSRHYVRHFISLLTF
jgi:hypothetical protein